MIISVASFPFSREPTLSAIPRISAALSVTDFRASSLGSPYEAALEAQNNVKELYLASSSEASYGVLRWFDAPPVPIEMQYCTPAS